MTILFTAIFSFALGCSITAYVVGREKKKPIFDLLNEHLIDNLSFRYRAELLEFE